MASFATQAPSMTSVPLARDGRAREARSARVANSSRRERRRPISRGVRILHDGGVDALYRSLEVVTRALIRVIRALGDRRSAPSRTQPPQNPNFVKIDSALDGPSVASVRPSKSKRRKIRRQRARASRDHTMGAGCAETGPVAATATVGSPPPTTPRGFIVRPHASVAPMDIATEVPLAGTSLIGMQMDSLEKNMKLPDVLPTQPSFIFGSALNPSASSFVTRAFAFGGPSLEEGGRNPLLCAAVKSYASILQEEQVTHPALS